MKARQTPVIKPRVTIHLVDGEWVERKLQVVQPVEVEYDEPWPTCGAPVVGKPCPKCKGSTTLVLHDKRELLCLWCKNGNGNGLITVKDKKIFDSRVSRGLPVCFIMTIA